MDELFRTKKFAEIQANRLNRARKSVEDIPMDTFIATEDSRITESVFSELEVISLTLHDDGIRIDSEEANILYEQFQGWSVDTHGTQMFESGQKIDVIIPFSGDEWLWGARPTRWSDQTVEAFVLPNGDGKGGIVKVTVMGSDSWPKEQFKRDIDMRLDLIRKNVKQLYDDIAGLNRSLEIAISEKIKERRRRLDRHKTVCELIEIPLARRDGTPDFKPIPIKRREIVTLQTNPPSSEEFGITERRFDEILNIIRHFCRSLERTPGLCGKLLEEELRDLILAGLNLYFKGRAAGETFRKRGKTDINIEEKDRAAFVAECKVWQGPKSASDSIDQLLNYLTWRDCKAAIIHFNKSVKGFASIQAKFEQECKAHAHFVSSIEETQSGEWRFSFRSRDDTDRRITIHAFLFDFHS